jgi:hypothetical protein
MGWSRPCSCPISEHARRCGGFIPKSTPCPRTTAVVEVWRRTFDLPDEPAGCRPTRIIFGSALKRRGSRGPPPEVASLCSAERMMRASKSARKPVGRGTRSINDCKPQETSPILACPIDALACWYIRGFVRRRDYRHCRPLWLQFARAGAAKIVINDAHIRPTKNAGTIGQSILAKPALLIVGKLAGGRLPRQRPLASAWRRHPIFLRVLAPHRGRKPRGARQFGSQGSRKPVFLRPALCDPKVKPHDTRPITLDERVPRARSPSIKINSEWLMSAKRGGNPLLHFAF